MDLFALSLLLLIFLQIYSVQNWCDIIDNYSHFKKAADMFLFFKL